jgi:hypothetical protein
MGNKFPDVRPIGSWQNVLAWGLMSPAVRLEASGGRGGLRREQVVNNNYPSLGFFIRIDSKKVKLVCFDTVF